MTATEFRHIALSFPEAVELAHMDHPDFRIAGKIFASLGIPDESWGMVNLTPEQQRVFISKAPKVFSPCNGAWGKRGYTNVHLASAEKPILQAALSAASKKVAPPAKKSSGPKKP